MSFRDLPAAARAYILSSIALSVAIMAVLSREPKHFDVALVVLVALASLANWLKLEMNVKGATITLGNTVTFLAILLRPHYLDAILVAATGGFVGTVLRRLPKPDGAKPVLDWYKPALSISNLIQSAAAGAFLWRLIVGGPIDLPITIEDLFGLTCVAGAYFLVNTIGISLAVAFSRKLPVLEVWRGNYLWTFPGYLSATSVAAVAALLYGPLKLGAFLVLPPAYLIYHMYQLHIDKIQAELRHVAELNQLNERVISTLAMTIEAKDRYTHKHVERVREYALAMAREMGVSGPEIEAVRIGAMVHDIGKIAVPEMILTKPGKLTSDEFERMKSHVPVGVKIMEAVRFPFPAVDAVAAHHERWDGNGYPRGLKGTEIPLVGRIVALADGFDALTSDRHYRKALSQQDALELIESHRGTHYDPAVVDALIRAIPTVTPLIEDLDKQEWDADELSGRRTIVFQDALEEIAHAAEEAVVLADLWLRASPSQSPTDVVDLLLEKVMTLLPATSSAVFLADENRENIEVRGARGLYGPLFHSLSMKVGEGVSGWVVARCEPSVNSPAAGDIARRVAPHENLELNSTLSVPLQVGDTCMGAVTIYNTGYNLYNDHHLRLLTTLAEHASSALDSISRMQTSQLLAYTDSLTELPNMRFLIERLGGMIETGHAFSVILLDLNGFKMINDMWGHLEGDRVLRDIARLLRDSTRSDDVVGRYAGDEFVIISSSRTAEDSPRIVERIHNSLARYRPVDSTAHTISGSIGVSQYPADGDDWRSLFSAADRRMYNDKLRPRTPPVSGRTATWLEQPAPSSGSSG